MLDRTVIETLDVAAPAFWAQPPAAREAAFRRLRTETPVFWSEPGPSSLVPQEDAPAGFWSLTRYANVQFASRNPALFSAAAAGSLASVPLGIADVAGSLTAHDGAGHTRLRGIVLDAFTPGNLRTLQEWIRDHARDLVGELAGRGEGDVVELLARPLPGRILASCFGLDERGSHQRGVRAAQDLLGFQEDDVRGGRSPLEHFADCVMTLRTLAGELAEERRSRPGEDLMTWLVQAEWEGERLSGEELASLFVLLAVASADTIRDACAGAVHALTCFPDARAALAGDVHGRVEGTVEEVLRWVTPLVHARRTALADVEIGGRRIRAGDTVVLWLGSANRDERFWPEPSTFDIFRSPNRHVAFGGGGAHYCLGAALARTAIRAVLTELYTRIPDISAPDAEYLTGTVTNGIRALPATWTPG